MTYKINQKHLQDFKEGKIAIEFNSDIKLLQQVIKEAFPNEIYIVGGGFKYYFKNLNAETGDKRQYIDFNSETDLPTIPLFNFTQLDNNNMETTKKIAYYVVKTDILWGRNGSYWGKDSKIYATNTDSLLYFKYLGLTEKPDILEPVYEKQEKVISMGSFNLTVKPEGIFHSSEDITTFVEGISANLGKFISNKKYGKLGKEYDFTVKDVIISKTGCQNSETKLSQWLAVWEEYIKIKQ